MNIRKMEAKLAKMEKELANDRGPSPLVRVYKRREIDEVRKQIKKAKRDEARME